MGIRIREYDKVMKERRNERIVYRAGLKFMGNHKDY